MGIFFETNNNEACHGIHKWRKKKTKKKIYVRNWKFFTGIKRLNCACKVFFES